MSRKITLGVTDLSFHRVTAALVTHTLKEMGFSVFIVYAKHEDNFENLQAGKTDLLCSAWLPSSHGVYKENVEKQVPLLSLGLHYEPYALWGVPDYVPKELVSSVTDLLNREVSDKMNPKIQGINPGAGITRFSQAIMEEYGLADAGYQFFTGTEEDCFTAFERAVEKKEWLVVPLWQPQFLHHHYPIRELKEPLGLLGGVDKAVLLLRGDKKTLFSKDELSILDNLTFSNEIISALDYQLCRENRSLDAIADHS